MLLCAPYDRTRAVEYARTWALSRNPLFFDFTGGGGNCTNFVSQCLLCGSLTMEPTEVFGWYYKNIDSRSPSWTGVREFYEFMLGIGDFAPVNARRGPFCSETDRGGIDAGDVIQLANEQGVFYHSLLVSGFADGDVLVCAQSNDALDRPLSTYSYAAARFLHVRGVRIEARSDPLYLSSLLDGTAIPPSDTVFVQTEK